MSRQPRLYPKSQIPGISNGIVALGGAVAPLSSARPEPPQHSGEAKRHHRIFRTKRKHVLKACDRCRVKKTKVCPQTTFILSAHRFISLIFLSLRLSLSVAVLKKVEKKRKIKQFYLIEGKN
jgi:hypothetical protein